MSYCLLLEADRGLARAASEASGATDRLRKVKVQKIERGVGPFEPAALTPESTLGLLVGRGLIARVAEVSGGRSVELLSTGDLLQPNAVEPPSFARVSWSIVEPVEMLVIDEEAARQIAAEHEVLAEFMSRGTRRAHNVTVSAAIESVVGIENRVLLALWQLAERYGELSREGVRMSLSLTHDMLSVLVGSRRPSVTLALSSLEGRDLVVRLPDQSWLLKGGPPDP